MGTGDESTPIKPAKTAASTQVFTDLAFSQFQNQAFARMVERAQSLITILCFCRKYQQHPPILIGQALCRFYVVFNICFEFINLASAKTVFEYEILGAYSSAPCVGFLWSWGYTASLFCLNCCFSSSSSLSVGRPGEYFLLFGTTEGCVCVLAIVVLFIFQN